MTGTANSAATVSVNGQPAARRGDYFYKELAVDNSAAPAYAPINVVGAQNNFGPGGEDAVSEKGGRAFVPSAVETYVHDADGNLTSDGRWAYTWDAENRLSSMEARPNVPAEARLRLEFAYDYSGRRIEKKVSAWNAAAGGYQLQSVSRFVYDGWNLLAEMDGAGALVRSYVWGRDVSDPLGEQGGVNLYGFVGNDPVGKADPFGLYEIDVHYYLTYFLTRQVGCFTPDEAKYVADGNQGADTDEQYAPAQGAWHHHSILPGKIGKDQRRRHEEYHALTNPRNHPRNLRRLLNDAQLPPCKQRKDRQQQMKNRLMAFGRYLHHVQDMFSHQDYPDPFAGHGIEFLAGKEHMPNKTFGVGRTPYVRIIQVFKYLPPIVTVDWSTEYSRVARAEAMVRKTWEELKAYGNKNKCGCKPTDGNLNNTWHWIMEFLQSYAGENNQSIDELPDVLKAKVSKLRNMPWSQ